MKFDSRKWRYFWYDVEERWQRLGVQEWMRDHPRGVIGISAASLFLCLAMVVAQLLPDKPPMPEEPEQVWFYDLNTQSLFVDKKSKLPPIKAPSGSLPDGTPAGVRAFVFRHIDPRQTEPIIGFLEKFSEDGKKIQKDYDPKHHDVKRWGEGRFYRRPDDQEWIPADSRQGRIIYNEFFLNDNYTVFPAG